MPASGALAQPPDRRRIAVKTLESHPLSLTSAASHCRVHLDRPLWRPSRSHRSPSQELRTSCEAARGASFRERICEVESVDECTGPRMRKVVMPSISRVRMPYHLE